MSIKLGILSAMDNNFFVNVFNSGVALMLRYLHTLKIIDRGDQIMYFSGRVMVSMKVRPIHYMCVLRFIAILLFLSHLRITFLFYPHPLRFIDVDRLIA